MSIAAVLVLSLAAPASAQTEVGTAVTIGAWRAEECRYRNLTGGPAFNYTDIMYTIRCAARHWPVDVAQITRVVDCESGFGEHAVNPNGHYGLFQNDMSMWNALRRSPLVDRWDLHPSVFNARSSVVLNVRYIHFNGYGRWSCA